jgi:cytidylate kinase
MFSVYTISRQYGSGGSKLAIKLAEISGYPLVWRELINQAAIKIGAPDMALAVIDELGLLGIYPDDDTNVKFRDAISQVVIEIADKGNVVIVGRGSQIILKGFPNCLHLKIIAGMDTRIKNVQLSKNVNEKAAKAQIDKFDQNRQNFVKKFYQEDWNDPSLYDLTINTDHLDLDSIANWIIKF